MSCSKTLSLSVKEDDTPIESAIFSSANNAIYGVRGQWVYKFNATTGKKEAEAVIGNDILGLSSICEHNGTIYVSACWVQTSYPEIFPAPLPWRANHDIFTINPTTLAATNTDIWKTKQSSFDGETNSAFYGPIQIVSSSTLLWGIIADGGGMNPFYVDPSAPLGLKQRSVGNWTQAAGPAAGEIIYDSVNGVAIYAKASDQIIDCYDTSGGFPPTSIGGMDGTFNLNPNGLCYCPSNDNIYAVDGTSILISASVSDMLSIGGTNVPVNTGEATANPRRIKYCPIDGMIYVPGWFSNSVIVINPATNTVVATKTGFNLPIDCVFTGSRKFAVQNSSVGLREIT